MLISFDEDQVSAQFVCSGVYKLVVVNIQPVTVNLIVLTDTPIVKDSGHFQIRDQTQDNRDWDCVCIIYTGIAY